MSGTLLVENSASRIVEKAVSEPRSGPELRFLSTVELPLWDALVDASSQGSVFCSSWWLRAVGNTQVLGCFENGRLVAGIPLYSERRFGLTLWRMPARCPAWGPVLAPLDGKAVSKTSKETELLRVLAKHLSREKIFFHLFHRMSQNSLPFHWNGFRQSTRFTYVIEDLSNLDRVWEDFTHNIRGEIRKAEGRDLQVRPCDVADVFEAEAKTFGRQNRRPSTSQAYLSNLYHVAAKHDSAACFAAVDGDMRIHAANMVVWDRRSTYFFAGGADPELRTSGATSLLVWKLIQFAAERSTAFDFCGSIVPSIERHFRAFGGRLVPCHAVMKFPWWLETLLVLQGKM